MSDNSAIHWTDATWNPVRGCSRVSAGCQNCYAERMAARFTAPDQWGHGYAERTPAGARWTGKVELIPEKLDQPLRWRKPRRIFVNSTSDLFHEDLSAGDIAAVFEVMAACPQHVFQILTKRADRMAAWCLAYHPRALRNVWLGVSVEHQEAVSDRLPALLRTPAAIRFASCEPLLGPLDLAPYLTGMDWIIDGGESGPGCRPASLDWFRSIRDQCEAAGVAYFHKQHGGRRMIDKAWGGREMDGRTYDAMPESREAVAA